MENVYDLYSDLESASGDEDEDGDDEDDKGPAFLANKMGFFPILRKLWGHFSSYIGSFKGDVPQEQL